SPAAEPRSRPGYSLDGARGAADRARAAVSPASPRGTRAGAPHVRRRRRGAPRDAGGSTLAGRRAALGAPAVTRGRPHAVGPVAAAPVAGARRPAARGEGAVPAAASGRAGSGLRAVQPAAQRTVSDLPDPRELSRSAVPGSRAAVANRTPALLGRRQRVFRDAAHALALDAAERRPGRPGRLARASD